MALEPYDKSVPLREDRRIYTTAIRRSTGAVTKLTDTYSANWTNYYSGFKNPNWKRQVRAGTQAGTGLTVTGKKLESVQPGWAYAENPSATSGIYRSIEQQGVPFIWNIPAVLPANGTKESAADAEARTAFYKHWDQERRLFDGATFLAELGDTIRMFRNPLSAFRRGLDAWNNRAYRLVRGRRLARLGNNSNAGVNQRLREALAGSWLEWSFGVAPLISDIEEGRKALEEFPLWPTRIRISGDASVEEVSITRGGRNERFFTWDYERHETKSYQVRYIGAMKPNVVGKPRSLQGALSLEMRDFVPALWEWLPYSFLIDYFTNAGDLIRAYSNPLSGLAWQSKTVRRKTVSVTRAYQVKVKSTYSYLKLQEFSLPTVSSSSVSLERNPMASPPQLQFRWKVPGATSLKWLNIAGLATMKSRNLLIPR
jgi:hypothetical protein